MMIISPQGNESNENYLAFLDKLLYSVERDINALNKVTAPMLSLAESRNISIEQLIETKRESLLQFKVEVQEMINSHK